MDLDDPESRAVEGLLSSAIDAARRDETGQSEERWRLVRALHRRPEKAVFDRAVAWCSGADPLERTLGADVLAQLGASDGVSDRPFKAESTPILVQLLQDRDERVVMSSLFALGHLNVGDPADIARLATHRSEGVRHAVTYALGGRDDAMSVRTLLELSGDESGEVRDWATFGLGSLCTLDTPEVRAALVARLADAQPEVRGEAMVGLACRGDLRVLDVILGELGRPAPGWFVFEAAEQLLGAHPDNEELRRALATAGAGRRGGSPPRQGDP